MILHWSICSGNDEVLFLLMYPRFHCHRHIELKKWLNQNKVTKSVETTCHSPWHCVEREWNNFMETAFQTQPDSTEIKNAMYNHFKVSVDVTNMQRQTVFPNSDVIDPPFPEHLFHEFLKYNKVREIKDLFCNKIEPITSIHRIGPFQIQKNVTIMKCSLHGQCLCPTELIIGAFDNFYKLCIRWKCIGSWVIVSENIIDLYYL